MNTRQRIVLALAAALLAAYAALRAVARYATDILRRIWGGRY
jgi:hypothetical protein